MVVCKNDSQVLIRRPQQRQDQALHLPRS